MSFRETVLPSCWFERRLRAVGDVVFLVGADLIPKARRLRIRFAVPAEERSEFLHRLRMLSEGLPIAAQLDWDLAETEDARQIPRGPADCTGLVLQSTPDAHAASPPDHDEAQSHDALDSLPPATYRAQLNSGSAPSPSPVFC
jgi:hypothetical protein